MNRMIVMEGTSCSGKTSSIRRLVHCGGTLIGENITLVPDFPPLPTNYEESRRNERIILPLGAKRCQMARQVEGVAYLDRMLVSSLSISYAWNYGSFEEFVDDIVQYIDSTGNLFLGDCTVFLEAELSTIHSRNTLRPRLLGDRWVGEEVIRRQKKFYRVYAEVAKSENWYVIKTDKLSMDEIVKEIQGLTFTQKEVTKEQRIEEFRQLKEQLAE